MIQRHKQVTLAVRAVRRSEGWVEILRGLARVTALGIQLRCLYWDQGFCRAEVLRFLL